MCKHRDIGNQWGLFVRHGGPICVEGQVDAAQGEKDYVRRCTNNAYPRCLLTFFLQSTEIRRRPAHASRPGQTTPCYPHIRCYSITFTFFALSYKDVILQNVLVNLYLFALIAFSKKEKPFVRTVPANKWIEPMFFIVFLRRRFRRPCENNFYSVCGAHEKPCVCALPNVLIGQL